jgi:soluble cytochrome b562
MTDALKFLIENPEKQRINEKLKHMRVLLQQFVHLNADQRKTTLAIAENINNALYQAELNNESGPEDGSNFINPGILNEQIERAKAIQNQIDQLEANVHDLEKNFDKLSNEEKVERIKEANDFRNGLSSMTFSIQNNEPIPVSRNLRKHLMEKLQISINKMMEQSPYFQTK